MVHELEAECMRVYRRKVDEATGERALLHQSLAASEAEIAALTAALGAENSTQFKVTYLGPLAGSRQSGSPFPAPFLFLRYLL